LSQYEAEAKEAPRRKSRTTNLSPGNSDIERTIVSGKASIHSQYARPFLDERVRLVFRGKRRVDIEAPLGEVSVAFLVMVFCYGIFLRRKANSRLHFFTPSIDCETFAESSPQYTKILNTKGKQT
jgi:hypothetical protein